MNSSREKVIFDQNGVEDVLQSLAAQVQEKEEGLVPFSLVGIHTRGIPIAKRMAKLLDRDPDKIGTLDINLYRDDLSRVSDMPIVRETQIPFSVEGARILLVDDVVYTGRTIRAAMDALMDLGRPREIALLAMVDRGGRELPIQPDFCARVLKVGPDEIVKVRLQEVDAQDEVVITKVSP